jgi:phage-related protein
MEDEDKPITWIGTSRLDLRNLSEDIRRKAGSELQLVQSGDMPKDFKPMLTVGKGVYEVRIRAEGAYRIFYVARFLEAIYVLHVFQKKTQKTSERDIQIGRQRYDEMTAYRESLRQEDNDD